MDWDNDGRKDLILGERNGTVRIYLNTNTDEDPQFSGYTFLQMAGSNYDCGSTSSPYIIDWNNDGKKDVLCGDDAGYIFLLINVNTDADPLFNSADKLSIGAIPIDVGSRASPVVVDWDGDGKKDLLLGETYGNIYFYRNVGSDADPFLSTAVKLTAGGTTIDVGYYPRFEVGDWDMDGTLDIICGYYSGSSTSGIKWFNGIGPLSSDVNAISGGSGGTINFKIAPGAAFASRRYFLMASLSGTTPGTPLPGGATLPLNWDGVSAFIYQNYNNPMLATFRGNLGNSGEAKAQLNAGGVPFPAGTILHFAFTTETPYDFQSAPLAVEVLP